MVTFKGKLTLIRDTIDYGIYSGGLHRNLSEKFNNNLLHIIKFRMRVGNKTTLDETGVLCRVKDKNSKLYYYKIGRKNIDKILWENVGNDVEIDFGILRE